ncbi:MAG: PglZ domain-containing protein [Caldilinea sp.]
MGDSLQKRIDAAIRQVFDAAPGAWLVWCDPQRAWRPLLERVAGDQRLGGFALLVIDEHTAGVFGSLAARTRVQAQIASGASFVLYAPVARADLGWLWGQALLAERIYDRSLRGQLVEWGWRPATLTTSDDEVAALARRNLQQDPATWGSDGLQPDSETLLPVLAGYAEPTDENRFLLSVTVEATGLPALDGVELAAWRSRSLARLLVTQAQHVAPTLVAADHELLIAPAQRAFALRVLERWADSHLLAAHLPEAIDQADRITQLGSLLAGAPVQAGPFLSRAAEYAVFAGACKRLAELSGRELLEAVAALRPDLERHDQGFWGYRLAGHAQAIAWGEFLRLSHAVQELVTATPSAAWSSPQDAVAWYVGGGWRMDRAGEQISRDLMAATPELVRLIAPLRTAYRARWEESLLRWSEVWSGAGSPILTHLPTAGAWLKQQFNDHQPATAILMLDALRFDLGASLAERVDSHEGVKRSRVTPGRAPLPSITALGMGMALPIDEAEFSADIVAGKWQLTAARHADNLSSAEKRRAWWVANGARTQMVTMEQILASQFPTPDAGRRQLVVHDATIDSMGHDDQLAFQGSEPALNRYLAAVERLRDRGWLRILIVTDHGYIHWPVNEEKGIDPPAPDPAYASRRALAYPPTAALPLPNVLAPGGKWRIALPRGAASFRAYGGLGYFHGGASLQEWIIPCIALEWPQRARPVTVALQPVGHILSQQPKVRLTVTADSLLREESIGRTVEVVMRNQQTQSILFRSQPVRVTMEQELVEVTLQMIEDAVAPRGAPVSVEVRDPVSEAQLDTQSSTLKIELTGW